MSNTIDLLMSKDPMELSPTDIDQIIAHYRAYRAEPGKRAPKKADDEGPQLSIETIRTVAKIEQPKLRIKRLV